MMVSTTILYQTIVVSFDSNTTDIIIGTGTAYPYGTAAETSFPTEILQDFI
jgi:hypothetical protein